MKKSVFLFWIILAASACACSLFAQTTDPITGPETPGEPAVVHHKRFSGKHHSHKKQKEVEENSNFNLKQAQAIVEHNAENREESKKASEKRQRAHLKWLHFLNTGSRDKESKTPKKIEYDFY